MRLFRIITLIIIIISLQSCGKKTSGSETSAVNLNNTNGSLDKDTVLVEKQGIATIDCMSVDEALRIRVLNEKDAELIISSQTYKVKIVDLDLESDNREIEFSRDSDIEGDVLENTGEVVLSARDGSYIRYSSSTCEWKIN